MLIQVGEANMVSVTHHALVDATQGYEINALDILTFRYSNLSVNQLDLPDLQLRWELANAPYHRHYHQSQSLLC